MPDCIQDVVVLAAEESVTRYLLSIVNNKYQRLTETFTHSRPRKFSGDINRELKEFSFLRSPDVSHLAHHIEIFKAVQLVQIQHNAVVCSEPLFPLTDASTVVLYGCCWIFSCSNKVILVHFCLNYEM